jgi:hypothetical protein
MELTYTERNGIMYPNLTLPEHTNSPIGKYGRMRLDYLKKHRRGTYITLLTSCTLNQHLYDTEQEANRQIELTLSRLVKDRGITEEIKATNPLLWVQKMNNAKHDAEELVLNEIICH